ncbi:MAG: T9SS type A sorting domain-containing protein [Paludibacteraceae bacterium]
MKKTTLLLFVMFLVISLNAQNKIQNASFEDDINTFTVVESSANVLMRVANIQDATTQTASPTTATAVSVANGLWVKKAPNSGYVKGVVVTSDFEDGASSLNLKITSGATQTGLNNWYQCVAQQKILGGLDNTKKYVAKFWAKVDATANNVCSQVVVFASDNTAKVNITKTIALTGGTTWTEYTTSEFDVPAHIVTNPTANFSTAFFGIGIPTTYDANSKTNYSGVLLDNISLTEVILGTGTSQLENSYKCYVVNNTIKIDGTNEGQEITVFNMLGEKVTSTKATSTNTSIESAKGIYLVRIENTTKKIIVK